MPPHEADPWGKNAEMKGTLYDFVTWAAERSVLGPIRRALLSPLRGTIVEIGAGTGANFKYYGSSAEVLALEPDAAMLRRAAYKLHGCRARITLIQHDDSYLDRLTEGNADAIVVSYVLCSVDDPLATLHRIRRALSPDGVLVVMEHVRSNGRLGNVQDRLTPAWSRIAGGCRLNRNTEGLLSQAGFDTSAIAVRTIPGVIVRDVIAGVAHKK